MKRRKLLWYLAAAALPLLFLVPNLFIWISMRPSGASMRGTRRRNDADGSADSISCEPMNKENK